MKSRVEGLLQEAVASGDIPGASYAFGTSEGVAEQGAVGFRMVYPERRPMESDTLFDLASVTKCAATATALMLLIEDGRMRLDDEVARFIPDFAQAGKENVTIRHMQRRSERQRRPFLYRSGPRAFLSDAPWAGDVHGSGEVRRVVGLMSRTSVERGRALRIPAEDIVATATALTAESKEAIAFAILANDAVLGYPTNVPSATGAGRKVVLGKIVPGRRFEIPGAM